MPTNQLPPPPQNVVAAILEARQSAAAAAESATICTAKAHDMERTLHDNTDAYHVALHKCRAAADRAEATTRVVVIASWLIVAMTLINLALNIWRLVA